MATARRPRARCGTVFAGLVVAVALAPGCGDDGSRDRAEPSPTVVVATTSIWADVVADLACVPDVQVESIVPDGADPHAFEPSLADRGRMEGAALVVANGLGLEEGIADTLASVEAAGTPVFRVGDVIDTIPVVDGADADPHVWFDPARVATALPALASELTRHALLDEATVAGCTGAYEDELMALDAEIAALMAPIPPERRVLVSNHATFGYLADRYDLEVLGSVIPSSSTLAEPNPAALAELAGAIEARDVTAIFAGLDESTDAADALAATGTDVEVVVLRTDSLGEVGSGTETYPGLLRTAAEVIAGHLDGGAG